MQDPKLLISYAQNREDIILYAFFRNLKQPGFYIDIGAYHPEDDSVTKFFYERGWRGINIEPLQQQFELFEKQRPEDINLQVGVADKPGTATIRQYANKGLSTLSKKMQSAYQNEPKVTTKKFTDKKVPVNTLKNLLANKKIPTINFMKIDVEGAEYEVLVGNDWKKFRPQIICIEANHVVRDWRPLLEKHGYRQVFSDGLNEYYVANECKQLADDFSYVDVFLDSYEVVNIHDYRRQQELKRGQKYLQKRNQEFQQGLQQAEEKTANQTMKLVELEGTVQYLQSELQNQRTLKQQAADLYHSVDKRIMQHIDRHGYSQKRDAAALPGLPASGTFEQLMQAAAVYDATAYFTYEPDRRYMKLRYRIISKAYRSSRDLGLWGIKKAYRLVKKGLR